MKNLKTIVLFILGILWLPCAYVTIGGFAMFTIWIGDKIAGYNSFPALAEPCTGTKCILESTYKMFYGNFTLFICMVIFGIVGFIYIEKMRKSKRVSK